MAHHTKMVLVPPSTSVLIGSLSYNTPDVYYIEQVPLCQSEYALLEWRPAKACLGLLALA